MLKKKMLRRHGGWQKALSVQILANLLEKPGVSLQKCVLKSLDIVGMSRKHHFNFFALLLRLNFSLAFLHVKIHVLSDFTVVVS